MLESKPNGDVESKGQFKNRSRLEIVASIITAARGGSRKTHIMYKVNISHAQLQHYLDFLEIYGLVRSIKSRSGKAFLFEATERGMEFLREYERLESYIIRG